MNTSPNLLPPPSSTLISESVATSNNGGGPTPFSGDEYTDWTPMSGAIAGSGFHAIQSATGKKVDIRLMPWLKSDSRTTSDLQSQIRLIGVTFDSSKRKILELKLDGTTPRLVTLSIDSISFEAFLVSATTNDRMCVAAELLTTVNQATSAGLYHGLLNSENLRVAGDHSPTCDIDFLERFYLPSLHSVGSSTDYYQKDLMETVELVKQLVAPIVQSGIVDELVVGSKLIRLKHLFNNRVEESSINNLFDQWLDYFSEWSNSVKISIDDSIPTRLSDSSESEGTQEFDMEEVVASTLVSQTNQSGIAIGQMLGRFRLESFIGKGGMGTVYRGTDVSSGKTVAVKVLQYNGSDITQAIRRFKKEARILGSVQNEYVTQLYEVGVDKEHHYLAMEFIDGFNLKEWIHTRLPLEETTSLRIVSDIARALIGAHQAQIIHRDIKPENVLLARLQSDAKPKGIADITLDELGVKLTDFGIARQMQQSGSMDVTRVGAFLGTPLYMSPEQCKGEANIGPATDIYSLGITLYELLCGEPPFKSLKPMELVAMHCFDPLPDIQKRNRQISDRTSALVARMLAKTPSDRFADAEQLVHEIERLLSGTPNDFEAHPKLPIADPKKLWERNFQWDLKSTPQELWPHVSNTDRLNRAAGLPSIEYHTEKDPVRGLRKFGSFRLGGVKIAWEEHPFEWIEGSRMGVLREFSTGPFKWFMNTVELIPLPTGGTRLIHAVRIEPRNTVGRVISTIEAGWKGGRSLDRIYHRIDDFLQSESNSKEGRDGLDDAFEKVGVLKSSALKRLENRLELLTESGVPYEIAYKLGEFIKTASPQTLAKIRPIHLAEHLQVPIEAMLDACLVAASRGILVLQWDILCPTCRAPASSETLLSSIGQHTECEACDVEFQSNLGNAIELVFRTHPEIREVDEAKYCVGGPAHSPHVVSQLRLAPEERLEVQIPVSVGDYLLRGTQLTRQQLFSVRSTAAPSQLDVRLSHIAASHHIPTVRSGQLTLYVTNDLGSTQLIRIERTIERSNVVTAANVSALARFRELFPEQTFSRNMPVATEELTLLAVEIGNLDQVYASMGDNEAYTFIQTILNSIEETVVAYRGAVVKTMGEGLLASFHDCAAATEASIAILDRINELNVASKPKVTSNAQLGIAVHRGRILISTQNGRLDYFGASTRIVTSLAYKILSTLDKSNRSCIALTDSVFSDPSAQDIVTKSHISPEIRSIELPGVGQQVIQVIDRSRSPRV